MPYPSPHYSRVGSRRFAPAPMAPALQRLPPTRASEACAPTPPLRGVREGEEILIVPATEDHAVRLVLREGDAAELAALGIGKDAGLRAALARAVWAETYLIDGEPAAIVGLGRSALAGGHGVPWLLTSPTVERHRKLFLRESRRQVARMLAEVRPLVNWVHADYRRAVRWLAWLGFELDPPLPLNGAPFRRFRLGH